MKYRLLAAVCLGTAAFAQTNTPVSGTLTLTGSFDASGTTSSIPAKRGTGAPSSTLCDAAGEVGSAYINDASGGEVYDCKRTGASTFAWVIRAATTGNVATATALAANPTNCPAGQYPLGIDASGNVESCTADGGGGGGGSGIISCSDVGGDDAYTTPTCTSTPTSWTDGLTFWLEVTTSNTGSATFDPDGAGAMAAKTIVTENGNTLVNDSITSAAKVLLYYDLSSDHLRLYTSSRSLPNATGNEGKILTTYNGLDAEYSRLLAIPSTGSQAITATSTQISPDSTNVSVDPDATYSLCNASGVITAGTKNHQWLVIHNIDTALTLTLQDAAICSGSTLRLGGSNVAIGPRGSLALQWITSLGAWVRLDTAGSSSGGGDFSSNTSTSVDSEVVLFSGTAGKTGKRATQTGMAKLTSGVLSATTIPVRYSMAMCTTNGAGTASGVGTGWLGTTVGTNAPTMAVGNSGRSCWASFGASYTGEYYENHYSMIVPTGWDGNAPTVYLIARVGGGVANGDRQIAVVGMGCVGNSQDELPVFNSDTSINFDYTASDAVGEQFIKSGTLTATGCDVGETAAIRVKRVASGTGETGTASWNLNGVHVVWQVIP